MAKYVAIIDTDEYKNFKFFEDGCGEYLVARDENAQSNEWVRLPFVKAETVLNIPKGVTNGDVMKAIFDVTEVRQLDCCAFIDTSDDANMRTYKEWWNAKYKKGDMQDETCD